MATDLRSNETFSAHVRENKAVHRVKIQENARECYMEGLDYGLRWSKAEVPILSKASD